MAYKAEIPYGCYWSTPFARWQGAFASLNSIEFAAQVARRELAKREIRPGSFDHGVLGLSVPQKHSFYGLPWLAGMAGLGHVGGPTIMQACATGVRTLLAGAQEIDQAIHFVAVLFGGHNLLARTQAHAHLDINTAGVCGRGYEILLAAAHLK